MKPSILKSTYLPSLYQVPLEVVPVVSKDLVVVKEDDTLTRMEIDFEITGSI